MYENYSDKKNIEIFPSEILNPCTKDEISLYLAGLIPEEDMEDKISKAISICYYMNNEEYDGKKINEKITDILYLSSVVGDGGAPRAAHRIHLGLRDIGINSKMLVLHSSLGERNSTDEIHVAIPKQEEVVGYIADMKPLENYPQASQSFFPAIVGIDVKRYVDVFDPKIVQLHWINGGFIKIEDLGEIERKVVWRLPDCWAFAGGCYYFGDCRRYITGCGRCPKLKSDDENDLSREIWLRKERAWKKMDLTVVVPTDWMREVVESSTLLKGRDTIVIPNGLDLNKFYPINKIAARKALNIPLNKKVILYGAANALEDSRKGFYFLKQALEILSEKYKNEYYLVMFGSEYKKIELDIPIKFLGYIQNHYLLQVAYSAADIMIVPSLEEAFGQTVTEAMACATPVVSFQQTGPAGIIEHKQTGYLANYADIEDLSNGIEWMLSDFQRIDSLSNNARYKVETTYDIKIVAKQYKNLYEQMLNSSL